MAHRQTQQPEELEQPEEPEEEEDPEDEQDPGHLKVEVERLTVEVERLRNLHLDVEWLTKMVEKLTKDADRLEGLLLKLHAENRNLRFDSQEEAVRLEASLEEKLKYYVDCCLVGRGFH